MPKPSPIDFDRRAIPPREQQHLVSRHAVYWWPRREDVVSQFLTRYLFCLLGLAYFYSVEDAHPHLLSKDQLIATFMAYGVLTSVNFWWLMQGLTPNKLRVAMGLDFVLATICLIHDPYPVPPSAMGFLMIIYGNGLRYGMRPFAEALVVTIVGALSAYAIRYSGAFDPGPGDLFFAAFFIVLIVYSYLLMRRVDIARTLSDYRAHHDPLTGLFNRQGFIDAASHWFHEENAPVALIYADLNDFKTVNDRHGHSVGDRVLHGFGHVLQESVGNGLAGRWGGDEFVALVKISDASDLSPIIRKIEERARQWSQSNDLPLNSGLGVSIWPQDGQDLDALLHVADSHLYQHKANKPASSAQARE